jgi:hypothetical protein
MDTGKEVLVLYNVTKEPIAYSSAFLQAVGADSAAGVRRCPCDARTVAAIRAMGFEAAAGPGAELEGAWYPEDAVPGLDVQQTAVGEIPRLDANKYVVAKLLDMTGDATQPASGVARQLLQRALVLAARARFTARI